MEIYQCFYSPWNYFPAYRGNCEHFCFETYFPLLGGSTNAAIIFNDTRYIRRYKYFVFTCETRHRTNDRQNMTQPGYRDSWHTDTD